MNSIGGYFGLELNQKKEFHPNATKLNTGRNALEYILRTNKYSKIYLPYYTCDVILQPVQKLNINFEFYSINESLEPDFDFQKICSSEVFLYTNYFGLVNKTIALIQQNCSNLIVDNAQAFYAKPLDGVDTFYSARKFFGVPDGAYLYTDQIAYQNLAQDNSFMRFEHLLRRIDRSAEEGYKYFVQNDNALDNAPILEMSNITKSILRSIDYDEVASKRRHNYQFLHEYLKDENLIQFELHEDDVPMAYPYLTENSLLRDKLIDNKIYVPIYWQNVFKWADSSSIEYKLAKNLIALPIDQRYNPDDLMKIIKVIKYKDY